MLTIYEIDSRPSVLLGIQEDWDPRKEIFQLRKVSERVLSVVLSGTLSFLSFKKSEETMRKEKNILTRKIPKRTLNALYHRTPYRA